jgi:MFS family permease
MLLGGYLSDRLGKKDFRWQAWQPCIAATMALPFLLLGFWNPSIIGTATCIGLGYFCYQMSHAPGLAIVQTVVAPKHRAQAAAVVFFFSNLIGLGLGPLMVGYISDVTAKSLDLHSLSFALSCSAITLLGSVVCYYLSSRSMADAPSGVGGGDAVTVRTTSK